MSTEKIRGRNLVESGRFPDSWKDHWKRTNEIGGEGWHESVLYGHFLILNGKRSYSQVIRAAHFTEVQIAQVLYKLGFQYENKGSGPEAKVVLKSSSGEEEVIPLSGKKTSVSEDESWNPYLDQTIKVLHTHESIELQIHGAAIGGARGLRTTDFDVQIHLPQLMLKSLKLDDREYLSV